MQQVERVCDKSNWEQKQISQILLTSIIWAAFSGGSAWPLVSRPTMDFCFCNSASRSAFPKGLQNYFISSEHITFPLVHVYSDSNLQLSSLFFSRTVDIALLEIVITAAILLAKKKKIIFSLINIWSRKSRKLVFLHLMRAVHVSWFYSDSFYSPCVLPLLRITTV